jgi:hypothetical protein
VVDDDDDDDDDVADVHALHDMLTLMCMMDLHEYIVDSPVHMMRAVGFRGMDSMRYHSFYICGAAHRRKCHHQ